MWLTWFGIMSILPNNCRDPEAVDHIGGEQVERSDHGSLIGAERYMQLIGRGKAVFGVVKFPPELMAYGVDIERRRRHLLILDGKKNAGRGEKEDEHNENGDHGPGQSIWVLP